MNNTYNAFAFGSNQFTFSVDGAPAALKSVKPMDNGAVCLELELCKNNPMGIHPSFKKTSKTQTAAVKEYLLQGKTLTPLEALEMFGCFRLAAIVACLKKQGMVIHNDNPKDEVTGKRYAKYYL